MKNNILYDVRANEKLIKKEYMGMIYNKVMLK